MLARVVSNLGEVTVEEAVLFIGLVVSLEIDALRLKKFVLSWKGACSRGVIVWLKVVDFDFLSDFLG